MVALKSKLYSASRIAGRRARRSASSGSMRGLFHQGGRRLPIGFDLQRLRFEEL